MQVSDVSGDGKLDLVAANSGAGTSPWSAATGAGVFAPAVNYRVGSANAVVVAEFNGDTKPDIAVANYGFERRCGARGHRRGQLRRAGLRRRPGPGAIALTAGSLNGDAKADLVTANFGGRTSTVLLAK